MGAGATKNKKNFFKKLLTIIFLYDIIITEIKREVNQMINIRTLKKLANNDGLTLKNGVAITYKSGWQVADFGEETTDIKKAMQIIKTMGGNCGIWFADGVYYIDHSFRVATKKEALALGKKYNQISVLNWRTMGLAYC